MNGVEKYLTHYAEPEVAFAARVSGTYGAALVVPALGESAALLDGYAEAARRVQGRLLAVVVVNARADASPAVREQNQRLLAELAGGSAAFDVLAIDRSSAGRELPAKQGVGLARKIGMDVALALVARGAVRSPWLFGTDADATLPRDFFARAERAPIGAGALLYPFVHAGGEPAVAAATLRYEASLRYHVLGLACAGSPYAYQSVGSAVAVHADAYAAVRGVPKREAGEDFYLLDKVAKVAPIARASGEPIVIAARRSSRTPFGTGPAVAALLDAGELTVAHPEAFAALRRLLEALDALAAERDVAALRRAAGAVLAEPNTLVEFLDGLGLFDACRRAVDEVGSGNLRRRLHTWFDGRRTLRALHALRDRGLPDIELARALEGAPFVAGASGLDGQPLLELLKAREALLPAVIGPSAL